MNNAKFNFPQSGKSMLEILGVLAIAGIMLIGSVKMYQSIKSRQMRIIAIENLQELSQNAKLLFRGSGDYSDISVDYLIRSGALKNAISPVKNTQYFVRGESGGAEFSINLLNVSFGDCVYFATVKNEWVKSIQVNGYTDDAKVYCIKSGTNQVSFFVK